MSGRVLCLSVSVLLASAILEYSTMSASAATRSADDVRILTPAIELGPAAGNPGADSTYPGHLLPDTWYHADGYLPEGEAPYQPIPAGFHADNKPRFFNRCITHRGNLVLTGDKPMVAMTALLGNPVRDNGKEHCVNFPSFGKLRIGLAVGDKVRWLDQLGSIKTSMLPGRTVWRCADDAVPFAVELTATPLLDFNGAAVRIALEGSVPAGTKVFWAFGDMSSNEEVARGSPGQSWVHPVPPEYTVDDDEASWTGRLSRHTSSKVPNAVSFAGSTWQGQRSGYVQAKDINSPACRFSLQSDKTPIVAVEKELPAGHSWSGCILLAWGVREIPQDRIKATRDRITGSNEHSAAFAGELADAWYDTFVTRGWEVERKALAALERIDAEFERGLDFWKARQASFSIDTPDHTLNCLTNWAVACGEYYSAPPILLMGHSVYAWVPHISHGFDGYEAAGEHRATAAHPMLRLALAGKQTVQGRSGYWIDSYWSPDLSWSGSGEETIQFVVEQAHAHYLWTGDVDYVRRIYPILTRVVDSQCSFFDPDGDGLFSDQYASWFCDGHDPRAYSVPTTASCFGMLSAAADMAEAVGNQADAARCRAYADKTIKAFRERLWYGEWGLPTSLAAGGYRYKHPEAMEVFMPVKRGMLDPLQAYQAVRFARENLLNRVDDKVTLLFANDWYPLTWSNHLTSGPETLGMLCAAFMAGDADNWYPALSTYLDCCYRMVLPGLSYATHRSGAGGGMIDESEVFGAFCKLVMWGIFGVRADVPRGTVSVSPSFPSSWDHAAITTPDLTFRWRRDDRGQTIVFASRMPAVKSATLNFRTVRPVDRVLVDGSPATFTVHPEVRSGRVQVSVPVRPGKEVTIELHDASSESGSVAYRRNVCLNETVDVTANGFDRVELVDPQGMFKGRADVARLTPIKTGRRTAMLRLAAGNIAYHWPLDFNVAPTPLTIRGPRLDIKASTLSFSLRNNAGRPLDGLPRVKVESIDAPSPDEVNIPPGGETPVTVRLGREHIQAMTPGKVRIAAGIGEAAAEGYAVSWEPVGQALPRDRVMMLDLSAACNADLQEMGHWHANWCGTVLDFPPLPQVYASPFGIPFHCAPGLSGKQFIRLPAGGVGGYSPDVRTPRTAGPGQYVPDRLSIKMEGGQRATKLYLLMAGLHRNYESYMAIGEIRLHYSDGATVVTEIVPGLNFDWVHTDYALETGAIDHGRRAGGRDSAPVRGHRPHLNVLDILCDPGNDLTSVEIIRYPVDARLGLLAATIVR